MKVIVSIARPARRPNALSLKTSAWLISGYTRLQHQDRRDREGRVVVLGRERAFGGDNR